MYLAHPDEEHYELQALSGSLLLDLIVNLFVILNDAGHSLKAIDGHMIVLCIKLNLRDLGNSLLEGFFVITVLLHHFDVISDRGNFNLASWDFGGLVPCS